MNIKLYRGHQADGRLSMEIYAQQLEIGLREQGVDGEIITPVMDASTSADSSSAKWRMRFLRYWQFPRQVKGLKADIHHIVDHGYAHLQPHFGTGACCVTVHDLIPLLAARGDIQLLERPRRPWLNQYSLSFLKHFDGIVTPSQASAADLERLCGIDPALITIIPPIIGDHFRKLDPDSVGDFAAQLGLVRGPKWVMLSGQEFYKNHRVSLAALRRLRDRGIDVRILKTGIATREFKQTVAQFDLSDYVSEIFLADSFDLPFIYNFVDCLLFPSLYEGFGMPVAESAACGTPVVTSNQGALNEIQDPLVRHVACDDLDAIGDAVSQAIFETSAHRSVESTVPTYQRAVVARQWLDYYRGLLG